MRKIAAPLLALMTVIPHVFGCSVQSLELRRVAPTVVLVITHHTKPIAGVEVTVLREEVSTPVLVAVSDERGMVTPRHLARGKYFVRVSHEGFDSQTAWLEVVDRGGPDVARRVEISWADWSDRTSRTAGTLTGLIPGDTGNKLMDLVHPVRTSYPGVAVELKAAFSDDTMKTLSDSSGAFAFPDLPDGIYILTVAGGMKSVGSTADVTRLVIDINHDSTVSTLPLKLGDDGCGGTTFQLKED